MRPFQSRLSTLAGLVAAVALTCGWAVAWRRWQTGSPRPAQRIVAAVLADRAARPVARLSAGEDLAQPVLVVLGALAASRARRRFGPPPNLARQRTRPAAAAPGRIDGRSGGPVR